MARSAAHAIAEPLRYAERGRANAQTAWVTLANFACGEFDGDTDKQHPGPTGRIARVQT